MKGYFVYMFLDEDEEVLYIGSSIHLVKRIESQHFLSQHGNLSEDCLLETYKVLYHQGVSDTDMKIKERYLINTLSPKYNDKMNKNDKIAFEISGINWKLYSLDIEGLIEKRENFRDKRTKIGLKNYKIDFSKDSFLNINNLDNIWMLEIWLLNKEVEDLPNEQRTARGGYPEDEFYLVKINNELYIFCSEIFHFFGKWKELNDLDTQHFYPNIKELREKYDLDSFILINSKEKTGIFSKYYYECPFGETKALYPPEQLFMKYELLKSQKMIDEFWILRIDWAIKNYKNRHKIDFIEMMVYQESEIVV
ncbi:hypothetical protein NO004_560085 [Flavobacterium psychrophilum]|uniref:GIY-YIG nuclease family protein n=1 Tax=Flavobacterium psychrophilum TaxID=96345 RepID=UPI000B7C0FC1|nr:GIY-YIG nuclease family protein [Flavobacterium psychrophilum]SNB30407.1 hypothetical protein NO004_560085 [Flavobacterium psychrophilum]